MSEEDENAEIKEAFDLFDDEHKGIINIPDTVETMELMNYDKENPLMYDLVYSLGDGDIDYPTFKKKFEEVIHEEEKNRGYKKIYDLFIGNQDQDEIDLETLKKTCSELGETFRTVDLQYILDSAGNGETINFDKFVKFMEKNFK